MEHGSGFFLDSRDSYQAIPGRFSPESERGYVRPTIPAQLGKFPIPPPPMSPTPTALHASGADDNSHSSARRADIATRQDSVRQVSGNNAVDSRAAQIVPHIDLRTGIVSHSLPIGTPSSLLLEGDSSEPESFQDAVQRLEGVDSDGEAANLKVNDELGHSFDTNSGSETQFRCSAIVETQPERAKV